MTLPKKGSRPITVSDVAYRWRVRNKPTYCQGNGWTRMTFAVELAEKPGSVLLVTLPHARPDNWILEQSASVRPALVAQCIRRATNEGWAPHHFGSAHRVELTREEVSPQQP
ncbi:hypothetical protein [Microtetraspora malaysiensis]|uniref:hypothetical protein n=1 Tax=Microtetraspora malaysiensis TaxID=161358 RepID=UPI0008377370|nr:hypothetical protein [Microtetraspora malaysiensis]